MNNLFVSIPALVCFANDNDCYVPEVWAAETLARLVERMRIASMVHRDFSNDVRQFGDVVNTRRPGEFKMKRKIGTDSVTAQDASSSNVRVTLDQIAYVSFLINDAEQSYSFKDLIDIYAGPAADALARGVDRILLGQIPRFLGGITDRTGRLNNLSSSNAKDYILETRELFNRRKAPDDNLNLILSPRSEAEVLKTDLFIAANQRGDGGSALEAARLGRIFNFNTLLGVNVPYMASGGGDIASGTVTNATAAGATGSQTVVISGYDVQVGSWATVAGNDQPQAVTAKTFSTNTTAVTLDEAFKYAALAGAAIVVYKPCAAAATYASGHAKEVVVDGYTATKGPAVGQIIAFGTGVNRKVYTIIEATENGGGTEMSLLLDRPLEATVTNNDLAFPGPSGSFNMAFHKNAIALVNRPLALPNARTGVLAGSMSHNDVSLRVSMQYDSSLQATRVNMDMLLGVAILDSSLAVPFLG